MKYNLFDSAPLPKSHNSLTNPGYVARMPCISRANLLVGKLIINEGVDTSQNLKELSTRIIIISEVIKDQCNANTENLNAHLYAPLCAHTG